MREPGWDTHPQGVRLDQAEVERIMFREWGLNYAGETMLQLCARVAVALGARADGALREPMHGPVEPLDGSANGRCQAPRY